ncbi:MAG: NAD(P)-dependent oxidoreductase [Acidobacteria bacterium]|nr:NAD(P)-dependent oxidoreductase [Acidobacteriota bacterium]
MKVLVTGGTGFIGSHLVEALIDAGHDVYCAVRNTHDAATVLPAGACAVSMEEILSGHLPFDHGDALMHLAAVRHRWGVAEEDYFAANVGLTGRLLELSAGRFDQFVFGSSIAVFGWPGKGPIDESYPYAPLNAYGESKVRCEKLLMTWPHKSKPNVTVIRPSITYGRRDPTGMLTKLATMIDRGIYATVGSGTNRVQLVHVADLVQGFVKALGNTRAFGRDYIVTAKSPIQVNRLVGIVAHEIGKSAPSWKIPLWASYLAAIGLEGCYAVGLKITGYEPMIAREKIQVMATDRHYSIARAMEELEYMPAFDYSNGVQDFVRGLRQDGLLRAE